MHAITVRQMDFAFPDGLDPVVVPGQPEESYGLVGLSLLLPYLEPYLIRTMKEARKHVADPALREDLERFSAQEGQHYRQHMRFNEHVHAWGFPRLRELEAELDADYRRFSASRPLRWNLAYAEGFEALTTAMARFSFETGIADDMQPAVRDMWSWHLIEELEHRTVAFDVYEHVCGSYPYRLAVGTWAQWHMLRWIGGAVRYMLQSEPRMQTEYGGVAGSRERLRAQRRMALRGLLPKVLRTYLPGYTPHRIPLTDGMKALSRRYSEMAVETR